MLFLLSFFCLQFDLIMMFLHVYAHFAVRVCESFQHERLWTWLWASWYIAQMLDFSTTVRFLQFRSVYLLLRVFSFVCIRLQDPSGSENVWKCCSTGMWVSLLLNARWDGWQARDTGHPCGSFYSLEGNGFERSKETFWMHYTLYCSCFTAEAYSCCKSSCEENFKVIPWVCPRQSICGVIKSCPSDLQARWTWLVHSMLSR